MVNLRIKKDQRDIRLKHATRSALSEHNIEILFDKMTTIANIKSHFPRKYRETIEIQKHPNNLNRDNDYNINKIWKTILPVEDRPISLTSSPQSQFSSFSPNKLLQQVA